jgi:2-phosphosulfolactate phosphatase
MRTGKARFDLGCEWGEAGVVALSPAFDVVVVVDVLSFSSCVDIAISRRGEILPYPDKGQGAKEFAEQHRAALARSRGEGRFSLSPAAFLDLDPGTRVVLPSPNGAMVSLASRARTTLAGCLRNAAAVARIAAERGRHIAVIPAGERWPDGTLRPSLEDWLGAGAILSHLSGRASPEARAAVAAFREHRGGLEEALLECESGRELEGWGYREDVLLAAMLDASGSVPVFDGVAYRSSSASGA